jgi:hypothetical protein
MAITIEQAGERIQEQIDTNGDMSHNIVSAILRQVNEEHGRDEANALVINMDLTDIFDIHPVEYKP